MQVTQSSFSVSRLSFVDVTFINPAAPGIPTDVVSRIETAGDRSSQGPVVHVYASGHRSDHMEM